MARVRFDAADATESLGPGSLALLTGDYSLDATDVNDESGLSLSRSFTTLDPAPATSDTSAVFGPGWTASLDGPGIGEADETPSVSADDSQIVLTDPDGGE